MQPRDLDKVARNELKTLSKENADWVAKHLVMASRLIDEDPELAHRHAMSAARRAGRIAVVRESLAITAYETGDYALALRELRTFRRISGSDEQLPLMVDSERGVGRPEKALELGRSVDRSTLTPASQVSLAIAMSGARLDLGSPELALGELEIPQLDPDRAFSYSAALYDAYAEVLGELGRDDEAAVWRRRATVAAELFGDGPDEDETIEIIEEIGDEGETPADESGPVGDDLPDVDELDAEGPDVDEVHTEELDAGGLDAEELEGDELHAEERDSADGDAAASEDTVPGGFGSESVTIEGSSVDDDASEIDTDSDTDTQEDANGVVRPDED
ncbi:hypothetical protein CLV49_2075 [Labedella gwakjiensis]|uniref:Tetratricopeptide repeat protein n=1 Tax=Labedella gwakjiensis TaxID=390269 RepID=A0A2P8GWV9_9MICO|nr:hypothetical protein [Labedella gwakjiensis]PSL38450.1 hypothetical protein CLV49_2075 [Labedella gwakjiensis]